MKESGPRSGGMNRREFLKAVPPAAVGSVLGIGELLKGVEAQEAKEASNESIEESIGLSQDKKINFPDVFVPLGPEEKKVLLSIKNYLNVFWGGKYPESNEAGVPREGMTADTFNQIIVAENALWAELKKIGIGAGNYSRKALFEGLSYEVPKYFSKNGLFVRPVFHPFNVNDGSGISREWAGMMLFVYQISSVKHDELQREGQIVHRDILHIKDIARIDGQPVVNAEIKTTMGEFNFQNIILLDKNFDEYFNNLKAALEQLRLQISRQPPGVFIKTMQETLEKDDNWVNAAQVAMCKIAVRPEIRPHPDQEKEKTLAHETGHLVHPLLDIKKYWPRVKNLNSQESEKRHMNLGIHVEINPLLSEYIYGSDKGGTLLKHLGTSRDITSTKADKYAYAQRWILKKMIELISEDPKRYGMEVTKSPVSRENQILSQMDVLIDKPDLLSSLCQKILEHHNSSLSEDIMTNLSIPLQISEEHKPRDWSGIYKIGIPGAVIAGGALALEALRRRKNQKREASLSRQQKRLKKRKSN